MNVLVQVDPYARWLAALDGKPLDLGARGDPPPGYYRFPIAKGDHAGEQEAVAIWCDPAGELCCARTIFGDGVGMTAMQIDEMFTSEHYAIPYELYVSVTDKGEPWPELYTTRLRTKDITAGVVWSEEWSRARLAADPETHDENGNPRAVMGDNDPPADLSPDQALIVRIDAMRSQIGTWLESIGGKPTTQAEADMLGNYANKFKDFENEAVAAHGAEKAPHWQICKDIDAKWFGPVRDKAIELRAKALALIKKYTDAENAKRVEAARVANETARKAAERAAKTGDAPVEPIAEIVPEKVKVGTLRGGQRTAPVWTVTDLAKFVAYCAALESPPPDLVEACEKIARKFGPAGVKAPGMELKDRI
jgi:hypothetical protein